MLLSDDGWFGPTLQYIQNVGTQAALGGAAFSLNEAEYKAAYAELRAAYDQLVTDRKDLESKVAAVAAESVSSKIAGVRLAGMAARDALGDPHQSMSALMSKHEVTIATTLTAMAQAWAAYQEADYEGMAALLKAVKA